MDNVTTIADRLRLIVLEDYNNNNSDLARDLTITRQNLSSMIKSESIGKKMLNRFESLGYNTYWILTGKGNKKLNENDNNGTLFDNNTVNSSGTMKQINTPEFKEIPFYPKPLNSGHIFDISLIGAFKMLTVKNYDANKVIAFQNSNKEYPQFFISKNAIIIVDITVNPVANDLIVAVKENELILDIYNLQTDYDNIIGKVIGSENTY